MRKFAQDLSFSPSGICEVLKGRKRLSEEATLRVINRLKLKNKEADYFNEICSFERCKNPETKSILQDRIGQKHRQRPTVDLSVDSFRILSDWHHSAILAACEMSEAVDVTRLAKIFKLPVYEVIQAIERLKRIGLLKTNPNGELVSEEKDVVVSTEAPNEALQKFTRQLLQKANESQTEQSNKERVFGTEIFAFDEEDIPKLKEITEEYFDKVVRLARRGKSKKSVYALGVQAFRLNQKESP